MSFLRIGRGTLDYHISSPILLHHIILLFIFFWHRLRVVMQVVQKTREAHRHLRQQGLSATLFNILWCQGSRYETYSNVFDCRCKWAMMGNKLQPFSLLVSLEFPPGSFDKEVCAGVTVDFLSVSAANIGETQFRVGLFHTQNYPEAKSSINLTN